MRKMTKDQRRLVADFLANIGVAWFAAGVVGVFLGEIKNWLAILVSLSWGASFSVLFLFLGTHLIKR